MATYKQQRYDVALNGQGYILATKPETPQILASQDSVYNVRYAQGDRSYDDFSKFWFMVQTDWLGGFKDELSWADDAKYHYSTNIDTYSEPGAIKLAKKPILHKDFSQGIQCGTEGTVNGNFRKYIGTSERYIYEYDGANWNDISSAVFSVTDTASISQLLTRQNYLWAFNDSPRTASPYTYLVAHYLSSWVDCTADISSILGWDVVIAHAGVEIGTTLYVAVSGAAGQFAIVRATVANPTLPADWVIVINRTQAGKIVDVGEYLGDLYYLIRFSDTLYELRKYNLSSSSPIDATVAKLNSISGATTPIVGVGGRMLLVLNGKLNILLSKTWWQWDNNSLTRIWKYDTDKTNIDQDANGDSLYGGVISDNKIFSNNLIFDGTYFYNWIKKDSDEANGRVIPVFDDNTDVVYFYDDTDSSKLWYIGMTYKGTADKNYLVFSNYDKISGIDKLAMSVTINFRALVSGQKIALEYFLGELSSSSTWVALGNASYADDGGSILTKTFYFGDAVLAKKFWFRVKEEGNGNNTPSMTDFIFSYLPVPDNKLAWKFTVKCIDEIQRKDDSKEPKTGLWLRNLLREAWWTKSVLSFEDYDATAGELVSGALTATATTITIQNTTDNFPERGRILIGTEEIFYNGKNKTQFLNCTRGARGSIAATHTNGDTVSCAYRVLVDNYQEELIVANEPLRAEYLVTLKLIEV